ncbi:MAG: hypothetical protein WC877_09235 [Dehalococcoidales bacterium]|jgi:hypothetical protein
MSISGFIIGVFTGIAFIFFYVSLYLVEFFNLNTINGWSIQLPVLNWVHWINIIMAFIGLALCVIGSMKGVNRFLGIAGIIICVLIIVLSAFEVSFPGIKWPPGATPDTGICYGD